MQEYKSACFTGHRPETLMPSFDEESELVYAIKRELKEKIGKLITEHKCRTFYSGMAKGIDIFAAEIVLEYKKTNPNLLLVAAIPYRAQAKAWSDDWKNRYDNILSSSDIILVLNEQYCHGCLQQRNKFMVDNCECIIAVYGGGKNGTAQTMSLAKKAEKPVWLIDLKEL